MSPLSFFPTDGLRLSFSPADALGDPSFPKSCFSDLLELSAESATESISFWIAEIKRCISSYFSFAVVFLKRHLPFDEDRLQILRLASVNFRMEFFLYRIRS